MEWKYSRDIESDVQVQCAISPDPEKLVFRHFSLFHFKDLLMQSTMFNCILHRHFNCWLPYSRVVQNDVPGKELGQYSEVSVSRVEIQLSTRVSTTPLLAPYNLNRPNHPVSHLRFESTSHAKHVLEVPIFAPNTGSFWRLIALVSPPAVYYACIVFAASTGTRWAEMGLACITSASPIGFPIETLPSWLCVQRPSSLGPIHISHLSV